MTNPRKDKWQAISSPASVAVNWLFTKADYNKLTQGVEARSMDERWDIDFDGITLRFYRSWTGYQVYSFTIKPKGDSYMVESFDVEQDTTRYRRDDDSREVESLSLILEHVVGVKPREQ